MDGRTDRQKRWHTEVGTPPKNKKNPVYISGRDLTLWNILNVLMPVTLIKRQWKKKKKMKKKCTSLQILEHVQQKIFWNIIERGFKPLKIAFLFDTQNHNICNSQEFPQINCWLISQPFVQKKKLKFPTMNYSFKTYSKAWLCTHLEDWCKLGMV